MLEKSMETKYPDCVVQLTGENGNAVNIFMKVSRELRRYLVDEGVMSREEAAAEAERYKTEATSGDYDNVFIVTHQWVTVI